MHEEHKILVLSREDREIKMNILSLFDGMSCGQIAFKQLDIPIENYYAYKIDKYAIKTTVHNFPNTKELGDVFEADFKQYKGIDFLIGGSPCTYWSIAQSPDKRETTASGLGWELFSQYLRALHEAQPKYFIYENNKSMAKAIYESISTAFGFEPIMINSALVSAQNRQRYYWVGKRNEDGTYSKVDVQQPKDRGILLRDILDGADLTSNDKSYTLTASYNGAVPWNTIERSQRNMVVESVLFNTPHGYNHGGISDNKSPTLTRSSWQENHKVIEPVGTTKDDKAFAVTAYYSTGQNAPHTLTKHIGSMVAEKVDSAIKVGALPRPNGELSTSQGFRIYDIDGKSVTLKASSGGAGGNTGLYAIPIEFDDDDIPIKAISLTDGKTYKVYRVKDKTIEIKGKTYPIKLVDGYYIIRKLTVNECKRLQTVPEWFEFPVSDTQAYKQLG